MVIIKKIESLEEYNSHVSKTCVIKFSAQWCAPCKFLAETIKGLDTTVFFGEVDVDDTFADDITSNLGIRGIPVLIFFKDGKEVSRTVGAVNADTIYKNLKEIE